MQNKQKEITALLKRAGVKNEDWKEVGLVISGQAGAYCTEGYHAKAYPHNENAFKAGAQKHLADLIVQCQIACEELGIDFDEVAQIGFEAFKDRMEDVILTNLKTRILTSCSESGETK